jgi:hypothetical protein
VAKHQDLDLLGPPGPAEQNQPAERPGEHQIQESKSHHSMLPFYPAACSSNEKSQFTTDGRVFGIHTLGLANWESPPLICRPRNRPVTSSSPVTTSAWASTRGVTHARACPPRFPVRGGEADMAPVSPAPGQKEPAGSLRGEEAPSAAAELWVMKVPADDHQASPAPSTYSPGKLQAASPPCCGGSGWPPGCGSPSRPGRPAR